MQNRFNTTRNIQPEFHYANELEQVTFREYGRNIQNMARHLLTIENREVRTKMAITLVELMKQLNPVVGEPNDYYQKLWDHLHVMTELKLDVDSPFPKPETDVLVKKPANVAYRVGDARFKHYGRNIEKLVEQAIAVKDDEEREAASLYLCRMMKMFSLSHSKEMVDDAVVVENLRKLSNGKLTLDLEKVAAQNLLSINPKEIMANSYGQNQNRGGGNNGGNRNKNRQHFQRRRR